MLDVEDRLQLAVVDPMIEKQRSHSLTDNVGSRGLMLRRMDVMEINIHYS